MSCSFDEQIKNKQKGVLDFLVLKIVAQKKVYSAEILNRLQKAGFSTQGGSLYPLLNKMIKASFLDYEWKESRQGPSRKYFTLTKKGEEELQVLSEHWKSLYQVIKSLDENI